MEITELIEQAKEKADLKSDYALAKVLGVKTSQVSEWKNGRRHPSNEEAVKLATLAGLDEMRVIAEIELRTANSEKKKEFWKHYIESRGIAATLIMTTLAAGILLTPEPATASVLQLQDYGAHFHAQNTDALYIMRNLGLFGAMLALVPHWPSRPSFLNKVRSLTPSRSANSLRPKPEWRNCHSR